MKTFNYQWQLLYSSSPSFSVVQGLFFLLKTTHASVSSSIVSPVFVGIVFRFFIKI
ncbi:hypothetical protein Hanom_Chr12g01171781 [Helianthus anomalus]